MDHVAGTAVRQLVLGTVFLLLMASLIPRQAEAIPAFARAYDLNCNTCHLAFPRLTTFGEQFASDMNMRMPNWREKTLDLGDERLALPDPWPIAVRAQAFAQGREADAIDPVTGDIVADANGDFQSPYLIKLLSSAPLTDHISFYFYGIFAEKGENGTILIEDAWFSHDDVFGSGIGAQLGQFQVSDLMFPREQRLNFQDYMAYRFAGITYERGIILGGDAGPVGIDLGFVNGNGIDESYTINSPGYRRPDHLFDNDNSKSVFTRFGISPGGINTGLFYLAGKQKNAIDAAGLDTGGRDTDKEVAGLDVSGRIGADTYWYGQWLWNRWDGFLDPGQSYEWQAGFVGVDHVLNDRWTLSLLYNHGDAGDFTNSDTIYEGFDMQTLTFTGSYYFMKNVKGIIELNVDLLSDQPQSGLYHTGHLQRENYILFGIDAAY